MGKSLLAITNIVKTASASGDFCGAAAGGPYRTAYTEVQAQVYCGVAGTIGGVTTVNADAIGTGRSIRSRKNGSNGNILVSPTDTTAGYFQDLTHNDIVSQTDNWCFTFASTGTPTYPFLTTQFTASANHAALYQRTVANTTSSTSLGFHGISGSSTTAVNTTESTTQCVIRQAGAAQYLYAYVSANAGSAVTITSRKNTAAGGMSISVGSGATGFFSDTSGSDTLASGDLFNYSSLNGSAASVTIHTIGCTIVNTSGNNTNDVFFSTQNTNPIISAAQWFFPIGGNAGGGQINYSATESDAQLRHGFPVTVTRARLNISLNATSAPSTVVSRKNTANGNLTISIGSGATGQFEDTSNSDTVSASDDYCFALTPGSANNLTIRIGGVTEQDLTVSYFQGFMSEQLAVRQITAVPYQ